MAYTYSDLAALAADQDFRTRNAAAAAEQGVTGEHPMTWADRNAWTLAASPTFADRYAYAVANSHPRPGFDVAVIPDADIRAAVQHLLAPPVVVQPVPDATWTKALIVAWLEDSGVDLGGKAASNLSKDELLELVADVGTP